MNGRIVTSPWNAAVTIDGNGHTLSGDSTGAGIALAGYQTLGGGNIIRNLNIVNFGTGISGNSSGNVITRNTFSGNQTALSFVTYHCTGRQCQQAKNNSAGGNNFMSSNAAQVSDLSYSCYFSSCSAPYHESINVYDGNYWQGWTGAGANGSLLPYAIAANQADGHPLSQPAVACGQPGISVRPLQAFWASYSDYLDHKLSVSYEFSNSAVSGAVGLQVAGCSATNGVGCESPLPLPVGDVAGLSSASKTLTYDVPGGVSGFRTSIFLSSGDACGASYTYQ